VNKKVAVKLNVRFNFVNGYSRLVALQDMHRRKTQYPNETGRDSIISVEHPGLVH
jgi:hypothetical protein